MDSGARPDASGRKRTISRFGVASQRCAAFRTSADGERAIAPQVGVELPGIAEEGVVLVEQIGLAAEAADALQARDELELLLVAGAIELGLGRAGPRQQVRAPA